MARTVSLACLGDNHLWQDLQLGSRAELSAQAVAQRANAAFRGIRDEATLGEVEGALLRIGEAREAALLAVGVEDAGAAGEQLVRIRLVAHVPQDAVGGEIEGPVQGDAQLDGAEVARQVPAVRAHRRLDPFAHLHRELGELGRGHPAQIGRSDQAVEQGRHGRAA